MRRNPEDGQKRSRDESDADKENEVSVMLRYVYLILEALTVTAFTIY